MATLVIWIIIILIILFFVYKFKKKAKMGCQCEGCDKTGLCGSVNKKEKSDVQNK